MILRSSSDGDINPADRYFEMGEALTKLLDAGVPEILLLADSEPNLHGRPMPADYWNRIATFFLLVDKQFSEHNRSGRLKYVSPPMALAQGEEAWLSAATVKRMQGLNEGGDENLLTGFDCYASHFYGQQDEGLIDHAIALAQRYAPGVPIVAAEVGDSSNADPSTKADAIIHYLKKLERAGAYAACLFIVGSDDPQWSTFILPVDQIRHIAASVPQEEPAMSVTVTQIDSPSAAPGGVVEMRLRITGISNTPLDLVTLDVAYPTIPGTDDSRYGRNALGRLDVADDGEYVARVQLGEMTEPMPGQGFGELRGNVLSNTGATILNTPFGPFFFVIQPNVAPVPVIPVAPSDQEHIDHSLMNIHFSAGDAYNRTKNPLYLDIQQAVAALKEGKTSFPWPRR